MRYYEIVISPSDKTKKSFDPITFSTLTNTGNVNGAALSMYIDVMQYPFNQSRQNGYIKIRGVNFNVLNQTANFNFAKIKISVGMSKGLPYATAAPKPGLIIDGTILQCFGNWIGTDVSLDLVVGPATYNPNINTNIPFDWGTAETLEQAVRKSLGVAYPSVPVNGSFSDKLKYTEPQWGTYNNLLEFSKQVFAYSKQINPSSSYAGATITSTATGFLLTDGTVAPPKKINVNFQDIIGNLTWKNVAKIQAKLVMRSDLNIGDVITFPKGTPALNVINNFSQFRNDISFQGDFVISQIRHNGDSRQVSSDAWCTIVDAVIKGVAQQ